MRRWLVCAVAAALPLGTLADERGLFIAVGHGGRRMSSDDGVAWENEQRWNEVAGDDDDALLDIAFGAGRFVAVGGGAWVGRIVTTADGRVWRELPPLIGRVATIAFGHGRFIAAHDGELLSSLDGLTFTPGAKLEGPGTIHPRRSACGDTEAGFRTVIIGDLDLSAEKKRVNWRGVTSDGTRWEGSAFNTPPASDVAYGSGHFVVVGPGGLIESSHDGEAWQRHETDGTENFSRIVWTDERFLVSGGKVAWSSADGLEWKAEPLPIPGSVVWAREHRLAIGISGDGGISVSRDILHWEKAPIPSGPAFTAIACGSP